MRSARFLFSISPLLGVVVFVSCGPNFESVAARLDKVAAGIEEYGTISVSSPLLFRPEDAGRFKFGLERTAQQYFDDAQKVRGASGAFLQEAIDTQFGATFRFNYNDFLANRAMLSGYEEDLAAFRLRQNVQSAASLLNALAIATSQPTTQPSDVSEAQLAALASLLGVTPPTAIPPIPDLQSILLNQAAAANALGTAFPGPTSRPAFPTLQQNPPALESPLPTTRPAQDVLTSRQFKDYQKLLEGRQLSHPSRSAIVTAAGDHLTQSILNFVVDPSEAVKFHGKRLYFAAMMVSVQPGDRTYRGYRADVSMQVRLGRTDRAAPALKSIETFAGLVKNASEIATRIKNLDHTQAERKADLIQALFRLRVRLALQEDVVNKRIKRLNNTLVKDEWASLRESWKTCAERLVPLEKQFTTWRSNPENEESLNARFFAGPVPIDTKPIESSAYAAGAVADAAAQRLSNALTSFEGGDTAEFNPEPGVRPLVAAVSPMTDVQTLDLSSSIREQASYALRLATALSGMGANLQAEFFQDWVRRLERDSRTLTNLNAVTSYSVAGGVFGYQVAPRLQGLADMTGEDPEADMILQPLTFPVLVILGVDERDLQVYDIDAIAFEQTSRWLRAGHPRHDKQFLGRATDRWGKPRLSEVEMMRRAYELDEAERDLGSIVCRSTHGRTTALLTNRIETLGFLANATATNWQTLDTIALDEPPPAIRVQKGSLSGTAGGDAKKITIYGDHLDQLKLSKASIGVLPPVAELESDAEFIDGVLSLELRTKASVVLPKQVVLAFRFEDPLGGSDRVFLSDPIAVDNDPTPVVDRVTPDVVIADGKIVNIGFAGKNLEKLFAGGATDLKAEPVPLGTGAVKGLSQAGSGAVLSFTTPNVNTQPTLVAFKLTYKLNSQDKSVSTPPILILPPDAPKEWIELLQEYSGSGTLTKKKVSWPPDVDSATLQKFLGEPSDCGDEANVSVNVTATENK